MKNSGNGLTECRSSFPEFYLFSYIYPARRAVGGVSRQKVNAIENNKYDLTLSLAFNLAKELQVTADELFKPS